MGLRFNDLTGTSEWQERSRWQSINRRFVTALQMDLEEAGKRLCDSRAHRILHAGVACDGFADRGVQWGGFHVAALGALEADSVPGAVEIVESESADLA